MITTETTNRCTIFRVTGEVTANEIMMQATQYLAGELSDTVLWDFTQATRLRMTTLEMQGIAKSLKDFASDGKRRKVALVASKNINLGLGKLFTAFAQMAGLPNQYKVFRTLPLAEHWLSESV